MFENFLKNDREVFTFNLVITKSVTKSSIFAPYENELRRFLENYALKCLRIFTNTVLIYQVKIFYEGKVHGAPSMPIFCFLEARD